MNRRNYLKHMALGAAAIAGSKLEVFAQGARRQKKSQQSSRREPIVTIDSLAENFQQWPGTQTRPANPPVLVTFHGLVDFYYNSSGPNSGTCGVGFHRGGGHHTPKVEVFETGNTNPIRSVTINNNSEVRLGIEDKPANVEFLKNGGTDDFRWLIDMHSRPWYPGTQTKGNYAVKLFLGHGTFFTQKHTKYLLNQVEKVEFGPISHVPRANLGKPAETIGDAITLAGTERVSLKINGNEIVSLPENPQKTYEVHFSNMCTNMAPQGPCDFYWWNYQEAKRNDFHHHRNSLVLPAFSAKYTLVLAKGQLPIGTRDSRRTRHKMMNTNDAPCMGAGYGGTGGP